jgi:ABC-2 type transport system permease protein
MRMLNLQAIYVMWLREMKRYARSKSRIVSGIVQPFFFLTFLGLGLNPSIGPGGSGTQYIDVLTPGIIAWSILFPSVFVGVSVLFDKRFGFLQEVLVAPVSRISIVIGRSVGGITTSMIQGIIIMVISTVLGARINVSFNLIPAFVLMAMISLFAVGIGLLIASRMEDIEGFQLIISVFIFPLAFLASPFTTLDSLPVYLRTVSFINPITYGVDGLRAVLVNTSYFPLYVDFVVLLAAASLLMVLASYSFSKSEL